MPIVIIATPGAVDANSYVEVSDATAYLGERVNGAPWAAADADTKAQALITATREIDRLRYRGDRTNPLQSLRFPRIGLIDDEGEVVDDGVIPVGVRRATMERALELVRAPSLAGPSALAGVESIALGGGLSVRTRAGAGSTGVLSPQVLDYLRPFLAPFGRVEFA